MKARNRASRFLAIAAVTVLAGLLPGAGAGAAPADTAPAAPVDTTAVNDYGACLAGQHQGDLLVMIDQSASLLQSDPGAARVTAANYLLDKLMTYTSAAEVEMNVSVAGFATDFEPVQPWTPLSQASVGGLHSTVDGFAARTKGLDTDYWTALDAARGYLAERGTGPGGSPRCQAIAWFTDGKVDFLTRDLTRSFAPGLTPDSDAGRAQMIDLATKSICRPQGIADQIRSSGIVMFGIGLAAGESNPEDFDSMKSMVTGEGGCGKVTAPRPGAFFPAGNIDDLLFAFDALSTPGQAPLESSKEVCQVKVCEGAKHKFVLDDSIAAVDILASSDVAGLQPMLIGPAGQSIALARAGASKPAVPVDGAEVTYQYESDKTISVAMAKSDRGRWSGEWALAFVDPTGKSPTATSKTNIHISGSLFPRLKGAKPVTLRSDDTAQIDLEMVDGAGQPRDPTTILGSAAISAELVDAGGKSLAKTASLSKDDIGTPVDLDLKNVAPGRGTLKLTLAITTAAATSPGRPSEPGTPLTPRTVDLPVEIEAPIGYPTVAPVLDFGKVEGAGSKAGSLSIAGPGCVWVEKAGAAEIVASPDGVGSVTVTAKKGTSRESCVAVPAGQKASFAVDLVTQNNANGAVNGTLSVQVASDDETAKTLTQEVRITAQLSKPLNEPLFLGALIATLIAGIGLPFLFLYLAKWVTSRIPAEPLVVEEIPITVDAGSVLRDGAPFALRERDLVTPVQGLQKPARRLVVGSVTLKSHLGRSPFGAGYVAAESAPPLSASSDTPASTGKSPRARMDLAVHNKWILVHDPGGPADAATVIVLAGGTTTPAQRDAIAEDLARRVPAVLADLRSGAETAGVAMSSAAGGSGAPFAGPTPTAPEADPFGMSSDPFGQSADAFGAPTPTSPTLTSAPPQPSPGTRTPAPGPPPPPVAPPVGTSDAPDPFASDPFDPFGSPSGSSDPW